MALYAGLGDGHLGVPIARQFTCRSCGHQINESEADDLVATAQEHGREAHDRDVAEEAVQEMIEEV
ncbi:MAG: hypothetical protein SVU32_07215 [Candidatus Nanohaloarchaea archaeon]|nr:hypothetical protein [Candidatus Nanohaloarchaea archaeon]